MRKEVTTASFIGLIVVTLIVNFDQFFNAVTGLFLTGVIPGTQIALPSALVFGVSVLALSAMLVVAFRKHIPKHMTLKIKTFGGKFIQIKV